jgi:hypothetical protein
MVDASTARNSKGRPTRSGTISKHVWSYVSESRTILRRNVSKSSRSTREYGFFSGRPQFRMNCSNSLMNAISAGVVEWSGSLWRITKPSDFVQR